MWVKALVVLAALSAARGQLDVGILAQQYYPAVQHARAPTSSTVPPFADRPPRYPHRARSYARRSHFDRDTDSGEGNDALIERLRDQMADPNWIPEIRSRTSTAD